MPNIDGRILEIVQRHQLVTEYIVYPQHRADIENCPVLLTDVPSFSKQDVRIVYNRKIIPHWVASKGNVWTKIPKLFTKTPIKLYTLTGNPSPTDASNGVDTFETYGFSKATEIDPSSKITLTALKATITSESTDADNVYQIVSLVGDFNYDFEYQESFSGAPVIQTHMLLGDLFTNPNNNTWTGVNAVGLLFRESTPGFRAILSKWENGTQSTPTGSTDLNANTLYYFTLSRVNTTLTLHIYSDSARTTHVGNTPVTLTVVNTPFRIFNMALNNTGTNNSHSYFVQNNIFRKLASPAPVVKKIRTLNKSLLIKELMR